MGRRKIYKEMYEAFCELLAERQDGCCGICGMPLEGKITVDHKVAPSRGGSNHHSNMQAAHHSCNSRKHTLSPEEYVQWVLEKDYDGDGIRSKIQTDSRSKPTKFGNVPNVEDARGQTRLDAPVGRYDDDI